MKLKWNSSACGTESFWRELYDPPYNIPFSGAGLYEMYDGSFVNIIRGEKRMPPKDWDERKADISVKEFWGQTFFGRFSEKPRHTVKIMGLKLVWWGLKRWAYWNYSPEGVLSRTYKWMFRVGPLEIRKVIA